MGPNEISNRIGHQLCLLRSRGGSKLNIITVAGHVVVLSRKDYIKV